MLIGEDHFCDVSVDSSVVAKSYFQITDELHAILAPYY
jgi:hypothetical protein